MCIRDSLKIRENKLQINSLDIADDGANNQYVQAVREYAAKQNSEVFVICAQIEEEISEMCIRDSQCI